MAPNKQEHEYDNNPPEADLYDDVIAPSTASAGIKEENGSANNNNHSSGHEDSIGREGEGHRSSKVSIYIGNLSWWTSDTDVIDAIKAIGVTDVSDVKFFENRANGQSKGFCVANLGSEASYRAVMEKLPKSEVHGQNPVVTQCNRQSLNHFELQSRKMTPGAPGQGPPGQGVLGNAPPGMGMSSGGPVMRPYGAPNMVSSGSAPGMRPPLIGRQPRPNGPLLGQPRMQMQTNSAPNHYGQQGYAPRGPPPLGSYGQPGRPMRPLMPHPMSGPPRHGGPLLRAPGPPPSDRSHEWSDHSQGGMHSSSGMNSNYSMHSSQPPMSRSSGHPQGANNVHLNPAFIQGSHSSPPDYSRGPSSASYGDYRSDISSHGLSEAEAEEILQKNRTVCSGAISRSIGDAASGKFVAGLLCLLMLLFYLQETFHLQSTTSTWRLESSNSLESLTMRDARPSCLLFKILWKEFRSKPIQEEEIVRGIDIDHDLLDGTRDHDQDLGSTEIEAEKEIDIMTGIMMTDIMTRREIIEGIELTLHFRQRNPSTLFLQQTTSQQADHLINNNSLLFKRTRDSFQHWIFIIDCIHPNYRKLKK